MKSDNKFLIYKLSNLLQTTYIEMMIKRFWCASRKCLGRLAPDDKKNVSPRIAGQKAKMR